MDSGHEMIIRGCCAGNRHSQEMLYNLYARSMMGVCLWYSGNKQEAEEILQDGFLRVFRYINKYQGKGSFEAWIRRIMINAALMRFRNRSHHLPHIEYNSNLHDVLDNQSPIDLLEARELLQLTQKLPPVYRMVFNLHVLEGLKHREIARILGISEGTSKSNLADARKALQKAINTHLKAPLPQLT